MFQLKAVHEQLALLSAQKSSSKKDRKKKKHKHKEREKEKKIEIKDEKPIVKIEPVQFL